MSNVPVRIALFATLVLWTLSSACGSTPSSDVKLSDGGSDASSDSSTNDDASDGATAAPTPGFVVTSLVGQVTEAGGTATFTVALATMPTDPVAIALSSSDLTEGTVAPASLLFTTANWNVPQTVTITGVDDSIIDGAVAWTVNFGAATSNDPDYSGQKPSDITVHTLDNDVAGYAVSSQSGHLCDVAGTRGSFTVQLTAQPSGTVSVPVSVGGASLTASPTALVFDASSWNVPQTVTLTATAGLSAGTTSVTLGTPTTSDVWFSAVAPDQIAVDVCDTGGAGILVNAVGGGVLATPVVTNDASPVASIEVSLASPPSGTVTLALSVTATKQESLSTTSLVFDGNTWNVPQKLTLSGLDDGVAGVADFNLVLTPSSSDARYAALPATTVAVANDVQFVDAALGATVTCGTCMLLGAAGGLTAANLVDGNDSTAAAGGATPGSVIATVDLGKVVSSGAITLSCATLSVPPWGNAILPTLQVSTDGTTYTPLTYTSGVPTVGLVNVRYLQLLAGMSSATLSLMDCTELRVMTVGP